MNVPEINEVKTILDQLQAEGAIQSWELPYENLLTRLSAAIFYIEPAGESPHTKAWQSLEQFPDFRHSENADKKLSQLTYRVEFNRGDGTF